MHPVVDEVFEVGLDLRVFVVDGCGGWANSRDADPDARSAGSGMW
jgi:hypothetical protein